MRSPSLWGILDVESLCPRRHSILIVDDEPNLRAHVQETIIDIEADMTVVEAEDGIDALNHIEASEKPF